LKDRLENMADKMNELTQKLRKSEKANKWLRENLFSSPLNSVTSLFLIFLLFKVFQYIFDWSLLSADFAGSAASDCSKEGACWVFIKERTSQIIYGYYPEGQSWRVYLSFFAIALSVFGLLSKKLGSVKIWLTVTCFIMPLFVWTFLKGDLWGLDPVETSRWGGLLVTIIVSFVGICFSLPFGILLALGRRSELRIIRYASVGFIEFWRGVPLITVLFMSSVMIPIFLPESMQFDKLLRALLGVFMFSAAYMAEVVRGGLQAIPKGQYEAADSLGLNYFTKMRLIIVPQALKLVIPGIVNNFIGLFKDTSLVAIIGMFDLLGIVQAANSDPEWLGFATEGYVVAGLIFWIFCFSMSRYSQKLELELAVNK
jgi:general L-amino acid transport system permease protein